MRLRAGTFLLAAALLATLPAHALAQDGEPAPLDESRLSAEEADLDVGKLQSVVWTMDRLSRDTSEREMDDVVRVLLDLGPDAGPCVVALRRRYGEKAHLEATVRVLDGLRSPMLDNYLTWMAGSVYDVEVRRRAYEALSRHGTARALATLIPSMDRDPLELMGASGIALAEILRRHPERESYLAVRKAMTGVSLNTKIRVLDAVAEVGSVESFRLHAELLGKDRDIEGAVVSGLARMQHADDTASVLPRLRVLVASGDDFTRRQAVIALGKYEDPGSIGTLIDLLASPDQGIRENALWSLRNVSATRFPPDPQRWRIWHQREMAWWDEQGREHLETLASSNRATVLVAIRRLSEHPLFRNVVYSELRRLAANGKGDVKTTAAAALLRLGFDDESKEPSKGVLAAAGTSVPNEPRIAGEAETVAEPPALELHRSKFPLPLLFVGAAVLGYLILRVVGGGAVAAQKRADEAARDPITLKTRSLAERFSRIQAESARAAKEPKRKK